jgi:hypothetical protein
VTSINTHSMQPEWLLLAAVGFEGLAIYHRTQLLLTCAMCVIACSVAAGSGRVSAVMESQLGAIRDLVWTVDGSGSMATASDNGSVCVWNTAVSTNAEQNRAALSLLASNGCWTVIFVMYATDCPAVPVPACQSVLLCTVVNSVCSG